MRKLVVLLRLDDCLNHAVRRAPRSGKYLQMSLFRSVS